MLDGEEDKSVGGFGQEGFGQVLAIELREFVRCWHGAIVGAMVGVKVNTTAAAIVAG